MNRIVLYRDREARLGIPSAARARLRRYHDAVYAVPAEPPEDSTDANLG